MKKVKRIAALTGVILIVSLILLTIISAFVATEYSYGLFMASLFSMIVIPLMIQMYIMVYRIFHKRGQDNEVPEDNTEDKEDSTP
ncbi:membrane protein CcdC involved in cytochrome C biogenesis [Anaerotaenia torta]|uniref:hypothetical protein n=1 Tax=Anaerotaenia torta TaxID=433293 RepID=UPI003D227159